MFVSKRISTGLLVVVYLAFATSAAISQRSTEKFKEYSGDRVVVAAPVQIALALGDRFLAANIETIRLAATGMTVNSTTGTIDGRYLLRSHNVVSELNPCHEDNYYLANAILAWAGADLEANHILQAASQCRTWDFLPAFLLGFNKYYFEGNIAAAQEALEIAGERSPENADAMKRFAVMIGAEEFNDQEMALAYLREQKEQAQSAALANSLQDRINRLEGLILLREKQEEYETLFSEPLPSLSALVNSGLIEVVPKDPLGIGYEFINGQFKLRQLRIQGVERPQ